MQQNATVEIISYSFSDNRSMKLSIEQYKAFLEELAKAKKVELADIKSKLANCGPPGVTAASAVCIVIYLLLFF